METVMSGNGDQAYEDFATDARKNATDAEIKAIEDRIRYLESRTV